MRGLSENGGELGEQPLREPLGFGPALVPIFFDHVGDDKHPIGHNRAAHTGKRRLEVAHVVQGVVRKGRVKTPLSWQLLYDFESGGWRESSYPRARSR